MRVFVLGRTGAGKTPFARRAAEVLGVRHVGASAWVRERFPGAPPAADAGAAARARFVEAITAFAVAELRRDPAISVASLRDRVGPAEPCVIEGMRNPFDFVASFDPRTDVAVFLDHAAAAPPTAFERGLDVIRAYVDWLVAATLAPSSSVFTYAFAEHGVAGDPRPGTLEHAIADFVARAPRPQASSGAGSRGTLGRVHAAIPPLRAHVRAEYLYGMDPARAGELRPCTAFAVSSYAGSAPTFQIVLDDGAVFSYLPPAALVDPARAVAGGPALELADLVYHDCKTVEICVHRFAALDGPVLAYFKHRDLWLAGTYLFTIDWYTGNDLLHAVALANGQYALLPSHKLKFGDHPPGFEPYKKIRREWVIGT